MNKTIKGTLLVGIGASSCGIVGIFVKKGLLDHYSTAELVFSQALMGALIVLILNLVSVTNKGRSNVTRMPNKDKLKLFAGGIPLALTNTFYYASIQHVPVSVSTVMLMQSVWLGIVFDYIFNRIKPSPIKIVSIIFVLFGTVLATNVIANNASLDWRGLLYGFLAAISYSCTLLVTNNVGKQYKPLERSLFIVLGALSIITIVWYNSLAQQFNPQVLWTWGIIIALFATILPPLLFTKGMPLIDVGLGAIIAAIELPVTVLAAYFLLGDNVSLSQWLGIVVILLAIVFMNMSFSKKIKPN